MRASWHDRHTKRLVHKLQWKLRAMLGHTVPIPTDPKELLIYAREKAGAMLEDPNTGEKTKIQAAAILVSSAQLELRDRKTKDQPTDEDEKKLEAELSAPGLRRVK